MAKKKATSSDVAARAGVSQATVSMVLNRKYNVSFSRETVERVEQAARELGYELPGRRKHKADRKEKLIVVFCPTLTSPYYVLLLQGIEAVANEQGYGVFICNTQRDAGLEEKYLRMMQTMRPAGIIYTCNPHPDFQHQVEKIAKETPLVIISNKEKTTTVDAINQDNTVVGRLMARHLLDLGHLSRLLLPDGSGSAPSVWRALSASLKKREKRIMCSSRRQMSPMTERSRGWIPSMPWATS